MPRRPQPRRPAFRNNRGPARRNGGDAEAAAIDAGARRLLASYDPTALASMVSDLRLLRDEADRVAFEQPSPQALSQYRRAARELAEAERALALAGAR